MPKKRLSVYSVRRIPKKAVYRGKDKQTTVRTVRVASSPTHGAKKVSPEEAGLDPDTGDPRSPSPRRSRLRKFSDQEIDARVDPRSPDPHRGRRQLKSSQRRVSLKALTRRLTATRIEIREVHNVIRERKEALAVKHKRKLKHKKGARERKKVNAEVYEQRSRMAMRAEEGKEEEEDGPTTDYAFDGSWARSFRTRMTAQLLQSQEKRRGRCCCCCVLLFVPTVTLVILFALFPALADEYASDSDDSAAWRVLNKGKCDWIPAVAEISMYKDVACRQKIAGNISCSGALESSACENAGDGEFFPYWRPQEHLRASPMYVPGDIWWELKVENAKGMHVRCVRTVGNLGFERGLFAVPYGGTGLTKRSWSGGIQLQKKVAGEWLDIKTSDSSGCTNCTETESLDCTCNQVALSVYGTKAAVFVAAEG
eukprot:g1404.t1